MNRLRDTLTTLLAVVLVLGGAYTLGGVVARRAVYREQSERNTERLRIIQEEKAHATEEIESLADGAAGAELAKRWVRD